MLFDVDDGITTLSGHIRRTTLLLGRIQDKPQMVNIRTLFLTAEVVQALVLGIQWYPNLGKHVVQVFIDRIGLVGTKRIIMQVCK